jgi:hypothetical protein
MNHAFSLELGTFPIKLNTTAVQQTVNLPLANRHYKKHLYVYFTYDVTNTLLSQLIKEASFNPP